MSRLTLETALGRAFSLRCPRCGNGKLFAGWFTMHAGCPDCGLKYERAPGYFLGSTYINYGVTAATVTALYMGLHFGGGLDNRTLALPLATFCVVFPLLFFRYARALWLSIDCYIDTTGFKQEHD